MNRDIRNSFGSQDYAFEELVAEFFSAFVSAHGVGLHPSLPIMLHILNPD
jgi:antirestriction protein ArdC